MSDETQSVARLVPAKLFVNGQHGRGYGWMFRFSLGFLELRATSEENMVSGLCSKPWLWKTIVRCGASSFHWVA